MKLEIKLLSNMKISKKLLVGFLALIILASATGYVGYNGLQQVASAEEMVDDANVFIQEVLLTRRWELNYIIEDSQARYTQAMDAIETMRQHLTNVRKKSLTQEQIQIVDKLDKNINDYETAMESYYEANVDNINSIVPRWIAIAGEITTSIKSIKELYPKESIEWQQVNDFEVAFMTQRISAVYYQKDMSDARWKTFTDAMAVTEQEAQQVIDVVALNAQAKDYCTATMNDVDEYNALAQTYHENVLIMDDDRASFTEITAELEGSSVVGSQYYGGAILFRTLAVDASTAAKASSNTLIFTFIGASIALGIGLTLFLTRSITSPLNALIQDANVIAEGDLKYQMKVEDRKDEIGEVITAIKVMVKNTAEPLTALGVSANQIAQGDLSQEIKVEAKGDIKEFADSFKKSVEFTKELIRATSQASENVATASTQILEVAQSVGAMGTQMAAEADKLSTSMQQVQSASQNVSDGSQNLSKIAQDSAKVVGDVMRLMNEVNDSSVKMNELVKSSNDLAIKVGEGGKNALVTLGDIKESATKVGDVIKDVQTSVTNVAGLADDIGEIASQVNMLALNAAIEAARAGEAGRGFAVVADAVKQLAGQAGTAAKNAVDTIDGITKSGERASEMADGAGKSAIKGDAVVGEAIDGTSKVIVAMKDIQGITSGLVQSVDKTLQSLETVNSNIQQVASFSEESAAAAEEASSSIEQQTASTEEVSAASQRVQEESKKAVELSQKIVSDVAKLREVLGKVKL